MGSIDPILFSGYLEPLEPVVSLSNGLCTGWDLSNLGWNPKTLLQYSRGVALRTWPQLLEALDLEL